MLRGNFKTRSLNSNFVTFDQLNIHGRLAQTRNRKKQPLAKTHQKAQKKKRLTLFTACRVIFVLLFCNGNLLLVGAITASNENGY